MIHSAPASERRAPGAPLGASLAAALSAARALAQRARAALRAAGLSPADAGEVAVTAFLVALGVGASGAEPHTSPFVERDPTLSQPTPSGGDAVPSAMLVALSVALPLALAGAALALRWRAEAAAGAGAKGARRAAAVARTALWLLLSYGQAYGVAAAATNVIKNAVGRQRPSFFALTNYAGYADAVREPFPSLEWSAYFSQTSDNSHETNGLGDLAKARAGAAAVADAQRSFPSGHASLSFAGLGWLVGFLRWQLRARRLDLFSPRAFGAALPLALAAWVCVTRVRDRKHNADDVSVGAAIGALAAALAWAQFYGEEARRDGAHCFDESEAALAAACAGGEGAPAPAGDSEGAGAGDGRDGRAAGSGAASGASGGSGGSLRPTLSGAGAGLLGGALSAQAGRVVVDLDESEPHPEESTPLQRAGGAGGSGGAGSGGVSARGAGAGGGAGSPRSPRGGGAAAAQELGPPPLEAPAHGSQRRPSVYADVTPV